jgi:hypothetical protein
MMARGKWPRKSLQERFMDRVIPEPNSGCWLWTGTMMNRGYGVASTYGEARQLAHRVSFEMHHRPLQPGEVVCHRCDVPLCVNPDHLFAGTQADNMHDMDRKGRRICVSAVPPEYIPMIRREAHISDRLMAWCFGVSPHTIRNYRKNKTWSQA